MNGEHVLRVQNNDLNKVKYVLELQTNKLKYKERLFVYLKVTLKNGVHLFSVPRRYNEEHKTRSLRTNKFVEEPRYMFLKYQFIQFASIL